MNFKRFISLLFIMLFGTTAFVFAANNTRNVYSVYSDNFNGAHIYGVDDTIPSSDEDGVKIDLWTQKLNIIANASGGIEGREYVTFKIQSTQWDVVSYAPKNNSGLAPRNMSAYAGGQLKFWARSSNTSFGTATVGVQYKVGSSEYMHKKTLSELNFNANGQWQELTLTLPTENLDNVISLFAFQPNTLTVDHFIDIDNIRWVKSSGAASFSVVTKNISNDQETTDPISFSEDTFGQGWSVASQYVEMDIDGEFTGNNWAVRIYSSATEEEKVGLYNEDINDKLPMAWKMSWTTLPFNYTDDKGSNANTLEIGENKDGEGTLLGLYDAGKVEKVGDDAKWLYPWFFLQKKSDTSVNSLIINNKGCHTFENTNGSGITEESFDTPKGSYATDTYERKPKLFLTCNTKEAKAVQYTGSLIINLSVDEYE